MTRYNKNNISVEKYQSGANLRIEAMLTYAPLAEGEELFRVNGPKGIRMMIMPKGSSVGAVREEYLRRYAPQPEVEVEEDID